MNNLINAPNAGIPALSHLNPTMTLPDGELWLPPASAGAESLEALPHTALDLDLDMLSGGATSLNLTALVTTLKSQLAEANRLKAQVEGENLKLRSQVNLGHELNGLLAQAKNERDNLKAQLAEADRIEARLAGENTCSSKTTRSRLRCWRVWRKSGMQRLNASSLCWLRSPKPSASSEHEHT
jgi:hypothetical protein